MIMELLKCYYSVIVMLFVGTCCLQGQNTIGTIQIDNARVAEGYTLFAPVSSTSTFLVDNCGNLINRWDSDKLPGLSVYLQENGNLIRTRREDNNTFFAGGVGGGIEIFDWDGNLLWEYVLSNEQNILHHDVAPMDNGNILAIAYDLVTKEDAIALGRQADYIPERGMWVDKIIEIQPLPNNGFAIVWEWNSFDHVVQDQDPNLPNFGRLDQNPEKLNINYFRPTASPESDWMHSNAIDYNEELDQILLNSRNFNEFFVIDHSTTTIEAMGSTGGQSGRGGDFLYRWGNPQTYGLGTEIDRKLFAQHDAHWIAPGKKDSGKVFVFNNGLNRPGGTISTVDIIETPIQDDGSYLKEEGRPFGPENPNFVYGDNPGDEFFVSPRISSVQQLPNDNILIGSGSEGILIELDDALDVVWRYVIPLSIEAPLPQGSDPFANSMFRAYKYALDFPAFVNNQIVVGDPIEQNPNTGFCENPVSIFPVSLPPAPLEVVNTLVQDQISIRSEAEIDISIVDVVGHVHHSVHIKVGLQDIDMGNLANGIYYIQNGSPKNPNFAAIPFVKIN